ncbi:MAG: DUF4919 domain-containing protein [Prevotellaceae bacterium]|jgi:protein phosphatase|nr:DUF4919 domain-containing protein [Prevotellaceae bacterium]
MKLIIDATCDMGCVRKNNEDIILLQGELIRDSSMGLEITVNPEHRFIAAVADGMGGHNAGEVASEMVLRSLNVLIDSLESGLSADQIIERLEHWVRIIHTEITVESIQNPEREGMGTTLVGILIYENMFFVFHAGDSRAYRLRDFLLKRITIDHSLREMTGNEHAPSNIICNSIGGGGQEAYLTVKEIKTLEGDEFILCSDGLSDMLDDEVIEEKALSGRYGHVLVDAAKSVGGKDNVSVIRLKIESSLHDENIAPASKNKADISEDSDVGVPDYDLIKAEIYNPNSRWYYPVLIQRFYNYDPTLTLKDYHFVYYGYLFSDIYVFTDPLSNKDKTMDYLKKENQTPEDSQILIKLLREAYKEHPFDFGKANLMATIYNELNDIENYSAIQGRIQRLGDVLQHSGDGKTKETAIHVISTLHENYIFDVKSLKKKKQWLIENKYDVIEAVDKLGEPVTIYFNVEQAFKKKEDRFIKK